VQGSVRLVVNADTGAIVLRLDYDSFGRAVSIEIRQSGNNAITQLSFQRVQIGKHSNLLVI
jgi:YD repeat-containing protein